MFKSLYGNNALISLKIGNVENIQKNKIGMKAVPKLVELLQMSAVLSFLDVRSTVISD